MNTSDTLRVPWLLKKNGSRFFLSDALTAVLSSRSENGSHRPAVVPDVKKPTLKSRITVFFDPGDTPTPTEGFPYENNLFPYRQPHGKMIAI